MGFLFSRPIPKAPAAPRHSTIVHLRDYVGLPLTTVQAALRNRGIPATAVAVKPDERYEPGSAQVPTGTLLVIYNCENYYVTEMRYS
jgi:hypothetical protein